MASYTTLLHMLNAKMIAASKCEYHINRYKELNTDVERIILSLNVMLEYNIIPEMCGDTKNQKESGKFREHGNRIFVSTPLQHNAYIEALKFYTRSIAYAPASSEQLAIAYANRSAVLIKLHKNEECIKDIERALALKCADNIRAKLYIRKVECLRGQTINNMECIIKETQSLLKNMCLDTIYLKKLNDKLNSMQTFHGLKREKTIKQPALPIIKTYNAEAPCASDALAIKYNKEYGRHIVATRDIRPGEVIATEVPYSQLLTPNNVYTHCSYCLEVSWASIPCDYCVHAMYCSEECKASDWKKYHDVECAVFPVVLKMGFVKLDLLSLRVAIQAVRGATSIEELRDELKEVDNWDDPCTKGFSKDGIFLSNRYRSVLGLATNIEKRSVHDLFRRSIDSCVLLYFVATCTNMFGSPLKDLSDLINNADVTFFGSLILRNQQMIPTNAHSCTEVRGLETAERKIAVLPFLSLFNHSCNPNISRCSKSEHIVSHAVCPIKKGEQILDNYGQYYAITQKALRQKELLKQYYFQCNCVACKEDWPMYLGLQSFESIVTNEEKFKIMHALQKYNRYVINARTGNIMDKNIFKDLIRMIEVLYRLVPKPCLEKLDVTETFKRVYDLCGNQFIIPEL